MCMMMPATTMNKIDFMWWQKLKNYNYNNLGIIAWLSDDKRRTGFCCCYLFFVFSRLLRIPLSPRWRALSGPSAAGSCRKGASPGGWSTCGPWKGRERSATAHNYKAETQPRGIWIMTRNLKMVWSCHPFGKQFIWWTGGLAEWP